ncbi:NnrS family protein [Acidovorax sp. JHL-9]|uniref:NnrS family protein n=1 Tax=Acidovorax sp. JHL-9 TaxID=1276756 RepID=UPI001EE3588A|nr:NnrS family protein [Acidovorax sp. JHL-9]
MSTANGAAAPALQGMPLLRLGFRPFYLGAALVACLTVPLWIASMMGWVALDLPVAPLLWHAHEMLFGFAATVIIGFLLTAVKAWTGLATPRGALLGALALLWLAARVAAVVAPYAIYAVLDVVLLPVVAGLLLAVLLRARNRRNLPLMGVLVLLSVANGVFHLAVLGVLNLPPVQALYAGLALIVVIECVMAGRVVPAFTMSVNPGLKLQAQRPLELVILAVTALALASWVCVPFGAGAVTAVLAGLAALLHGWRMWRWKPWITRNRPILWILHASYAWIPVGFLLLALAQLGVVAVSAAVHAFAVGATGGLIVGMITRTARGHTGRPLQAGRLEVLAYGLVMGAAVLRVLLPLAAPQWYAAALVLAALAWAAAFVIYLGLYTPWLIQTRLDGKDG